MNNDLDLTPPKPLTQKQRMRMIKQAHKKVLKKQRLQDRIALRETRKLTKAVKKAGQHAPKNLDAFSEANMYYSDKEVDTYIKSSPMFEAYSETQELNFD